MIVEDDDAIATGLMEKLRLEHFTVCLARDGEHAREVIADTELDLVILDIMLPKLDGLSVLRWLRQRDKTLPVLILSAKGREEEKVEGLRAGADDYLAKPFGLSELLARVDALLRRTRGPDEPLSFGDIRVDPQSRRVFRAGKEVTLSRKELELLLFLARRRERIVTRDEILDSVWGHLAASTARAVDDHILHLRRKLEEDPKNPKHIVTRHGLGYQLVM